MSRCGAADMYEEDDFGRQLYRPNPTEADDAYDDARQDKGDAEGRSPVAQTAQQGDEGKGR